MSGGPVERACDRLAPAAFHDLRYLVPVVVVMVVVVMVTGSDLVWVLIPLVQPVYEGVLTVVRGQTPGMRKEGIRYERRGSGGPPGGVRVAAFRLLPLVPAALAFAGLPSPLFPILLVGYLAAAALVALLVPGGIEAFLRILGLQVVWA